MIKPQCATCYKQSILVDPKYGPVCLVCAAHIDSIRVKPELLTCSQCLQTDHKSTIEKYGICSTCVSRNLKSWDKHE